MRTPDEFAREFMGDVSADQRLDAVLVTVRHALMLRDAEHAEAHAADAARYAALTDAALSLLRALPSCPAQDCGGYGTYGNIVDCILSCDKHADLDPPRGYNPDEAVPYASALRALQCIVDPISAPPEAT